MARRCTVLPALGLSLTAVLGAQGPPPAPSDAVSAVVAVEAPIVALTNVRVIDGTGAAPLEQQTLLLRDGLIAEMGPTASVPVPAGAHRVDLAGKSVIPGLVMTHEHLYYPTGPGVYGQLGQSFVRLYLAGGVTTMRTGGNMNGFMDLNLKRAIAQRQVPGPDIDATAPYVNGANPFLQMRGMTGHEEARRQVNYWADMGATSFKAYMQISRAELGAVVDEAHKRKLKVTGHLCSVTYAEAAALGIDNLEHGFFAATDFVADKQVDVCPGQAKGQQTVNDVDVAGAPFKALVETLVAKGVALTSTLAIFETMAPGRPLQPGLDVLVPPLREQYLQTYERRRKDTTTLMKTLFPKAMAMERAFVAAGGLLTAGTDPTGAGGVVPGYANQRTLELLVEAGFPPVEAIRIGTLNGARYLGREARIGSIARGKQADLVVVDGNPAADIASVRTVQMVFRQGVGYDPAKLVASVSGKVGLW